MYFKKTILSCTFAAAMVSTSACALNSVGGAITDNSGSVYLQNAKIYLLELGRETTSEKGGQFRFPDVPPGNYTLIVKYMGAETHVEQVQVDDNTALQRQIQLNPTDRALETILVVGQSAGYARALNRQRQAGHFASIISSDFIGKLPDENVSDALQRVSGVNIARDQGEGRYVRLRGLSSELNTTSINGLSIPSPESRTRAVALDVIPAILVSSLEVSKSLTPDMDGDAVAGNINIESLSGLDQVDTTFSLVTELREDEQSSKLSPKFAALYANRFDFGTQAFGVAASLSHQARHFGSENMEGEWETDIEDSGFTGAAEIQQRDYQISRTRSGATLNLDWLASHSDKFYLHSLYSDYRDSEIRQRNKYKFDKGELAAISPSSADWQDAQITRDMKNREVTQDILSVVAGGKHQTSDWDIAYEWGFSKSREITPDKQEIDFKQKGLAIGYQSIGKVPELYASPQGFDPNEYEIDGFEFENETNRDYVRTFKLDLSTDITVFNQPAALTFGAKASRRQKSTDLDVHLFDEFDSVSLQSLADFAGAETPYSLGQFGAQIDPRLVSRFAQSEILNNPATQSREEQLVSQALSGSDFSLTEDVTAAYMMVQSDIDQLSLIAGLRYEYTDYQSQGTNAVADLDNDRVITTDSQLGQDYDQWLPSLNLKYDLSDTLLLRGAYSHSYGRPSFAQLAPSPEEVEFEDGELSVEGLGNQNLKPFEAVNLDLAIEYYGSGVNTASLGLFYKQIDNFIFSAEAPDMIDPTHFVGQQPVEEISAVMPLNGNKATVLGLEGAFNRALGLGFYIQGNITLADSDANLPSTITSRTDDFSLPEQARLVTNLTLGYESDDWVVRVAGVYSDSVLYQLDLETPENDIYEHDHFQLDMTMEYHLYDNVHLLFSGINLGDEPLYRYQNKIDYVNQFETYGRSYSLALRVTNW